MSNASRATATTTSRRLENAVADGRRWDVVIDNTASIPRWVSESAGLLADAADLYLYTSSISAYADSSVPGADETAAVGQISAEDEALVKTTKDITGENYGPLKARCEEEARKAFPGKAIVVRPGLIVGPGDYSDRFSYWPIRIFGGGEVMAPGNPDDPVQFIDCRDLGEWYIRLVEAKAVGTYNGVGPRSPMSIAGMLYGIRAAVDNEISFTWVDADFLEEARGPALDGDDGVGSSRGRVRRFLVVEHPTRPRRRAALQTPGRHRQGHDGLLELAARRPPRQTEGGTVGREGEASPRRLACTPTGRHRERIVEGPRVRPRTGCHLLHCSDSHRPRRRPQPRCRTMLKVAPSATSHRSIGFGVTLPGTRRRR